MSLTGDVMETSIKFHDTVGRFLGRNGFFKATGLNLSVMYNGSHVVISPITSKGNEGRCQIWIPADEIENLIRELYRIIPEGKQEFFPVTSICREDLAGKIGQLAYAYTDSDMVRLAGKMASNYCELLYWDSLEILGRDYAPEPDAEFDYCPDCRHVFVVPEGSNCPYCNAEDIEPVDCIATEVIDDVDVLEEQYPYMVHTKIFDLPKWVEDHKSFMESNELVYKPVPNNDTETDNV